MDDNAQLDSRRRLDCDRIALKLLKAMAERDAAILERNIALAEKKAARGERDAALLRCDLAFSERDSAVIERDAAVAALSAARFGKFSTFGDWNNHVLLDTESSKTFQATEVAKNCSFALEVQSIPAYEWKSQVGRSVTCSVFSQKSSVSEKIKDVQRDSPVERNFGKDVKRDPLPSRKRPSNGNFYGNQRDRGENERDSYGVEEIEDARLYNSIPYCSCTGVNQPCYKWGNGDGSLLVAPL
uniref:GAGA-binding transcriptional activator n=1 Tax=Apopellia endiviifolia (species B) TaxID=119729 RepID=A0A6B7NRN3_9MARC|nr:putative GAGA-binding protein [Apopellia endiviifolia (species B)]